MNWEDLSQHRIQIGHTAGVGKGRWNRATSVRYVSGAILSHRAGNNHLNILLLRLQLLSAVILKHKSAFYDLIKCFSSFPASQMYESAAFSQFHITARRICLGFASDCWSGKRTSCDVSMGT